MKFILLASVLFLSSCATIDSVKPGNGAVFTAHKTTYSKVWKTANAVVSKQLTIVSADKEAGVIKAEKGAGLSTWGEVVGVFIMPANTNAKEFKIEVVSQKRSKLQITGQDWEQTIVQGMKAELDTD